jgi:hypothetical protein
MPVETSRGVPYPRTATWEEEAEMSVLSDWGYCNWCRRRKTECKGECVEPGAFDATRYWEQTRPKCQMKDCPRVSAKDSELCAHHQRERDLRPKWR